MGVQQEDEGSSSAPSAPSAPPAEQVMEETAVPAPAPAPAPVAGAEVGESVPPAPVGGSGEVLASKFGVVITQIGSTVTKEMVTDFVEFCGEVGQVVMQPDPQTEFKQMATVSFASPDEVDTALMLTGAILGDGPVTISKMQIVNTEPDKYDKVMASAKSVSERVQAIIKAGYIKGEALTATLKVKAQEADEKYKISERAKEGGGGISQKAKVIAATASSVGSQVVAKVNNKKEISEEERQQYQQAGSRSWDQQQLSSQPQW
eukprot:TRINITY_DN2082_c0_g1_i1.p1 TRINITY_DN2082_c0_g1~~TRINITY_DN2082_c0_g1_i1.p1  ORF type:complete len:262 (+),score=61.05 TRINITY_DN2082_c0_g1_i1:49-834(+)